MSRQHGHLERFLVGQKWSPKHARLSLPILVRWIDQHRGKPLEQIIEFTYTDLAKALGQPNHAHPVHAALGVLGWALKDLEVKVPSLGKIPPIQLLVWSKGQGSPGDNGFNFIISKKELEGMSPDFRRLRAELERAEIMKYPHWRRVLTEMGLEPLTVDLPTIETVTDACQHRRGSGESPEHLRLKHYLGYNFGKIGILGRFKPSFEQALLSGDVADLMLDEIDGKRRFCIEVKSRISSEADLIRGLFQCVKYEAVLLAHEKYEMMRNMHYSTREINVILATECRLSDSLVELSRALGVRIKEVPLLN